MFTISEKIPAFETYEDYLGYRGDAALFFDIETTGLSPASAIVFLIGIVRKCGGDWQLTQWLAQRPEDEPMLLQAFWDAAAECDTLIHFNGTSFDLPFIKERTRLLGTEQVPASNDAGDSGDSKMHSDERTQSGKRSLDLYQKFRPLKRPLGLARMNQITLEQFLGWPREDRLDGRQMISLFQKYAASQEPLLRDLLLLHNHDDLLGMTALLRLCPYSMLFEGQFSAVSASLANVSSGIGRRVDPGAEAPAEIKADVESGRACLKLWLTLKAALPRDVALSVPCAFPGDCACQGDGTPTDCTQGEPLPPASDLCPALDLSFTLTVFGAQAVLSVPGYRGELRHFFPNYRDYYYLPLEDQVIHKSVGAFVDRQYRTPATPASCCIKKSGLFFSQPEEFFSPAFRPSYESRELFFCLGEQELSVRPESGSKSCPIPESEGCPAPGSEGCLQQKAVLSLDAQKLAAYAASLLRLFAHVS